MSPCFSRVFTRHCCVVVSSLATAAQLCFHSPLPRSRVFTRHCQWSTETLQCLHNSLARYKCLLEARPYNYCQQKLFTYISNNYSIVCWYKYFRVGCTARKFFHANISSVRISASSAKFITRKNFYVYGIYIYICIYIYNYIYEIHILQPIQYLYYACML